MRDRDASLRSLLTRIAEGASLDEVLEAVAGDVRALYGAVSCKVWLVKKGDICQTCPLSNECRDRSMCLHLKASNSTYDSEPPRVPLVVFRDRVVARGGITQVHAQSDAVRMLFAPELRHVGSGVAAVVPMKGPAGVLGVLAALFESPPSQSDYNELLGFSSAAISAIRIADLSSRYQRIESGLEESRHEQVEVGGLLHAILYGSTEYNVIAEDLEGNITVFSEGASTAYGYAPDEVIGRVNGDLLYAPEELESGKIVEILNEAMRTGRCEAVVTRRRRNGETFPAKATFTIRHDAEGDPSGVVIVERDLSTERNSARLSETSARQVALLEEHLHDLKSSYALLEKDADALRESNEHLNRAVATRNTSIVEKREHLSASLKREQQLRSENIGLAERVKDLEDLNAIRVETLVQLRDERDRLREQIATARAAAPDRTTEESRPADRLPDATASPVSTGDLRRPTAPETRVLVGLSREMRRTLQSVLGRLSRLLERSEDSETRFAVAEVEGSVRELDRLVVSILDGIELARTYLATNRESVDLVELIARVRREVEPTKVRSRRSIRMHVDPDVRPIATDPERVRHILGVLLAQGVRTAAEGAIGIEVVQEDGWIRIHVTGVDLEISDSELVRIFDDLREVNWVQRVLGGDVGDPEDTVEWMGGAATTPGFELAIARRLAILLGGNLNFERSVGGEAAFTLSLPVVEESGASGAGTDSSHREIGDDRHGYQRASVD